VEGLQRAGWKALAMRVQHVFGYNLLPHYPSLPRIGGVVATYDLYC